VTNPYRAPAAAVADLERPRGSPLKGVIYGVLVDIVGTTAATMAIMFVWGVALAVNGASAEDIQAMAQKIDPTSFVGLLASAVGCAFSFLGGYVCARVAGRGELKWAAVMAVISTVFGLLMTMHVPRDAFNTVMLVASFVIVLLGGYVGARRNARNA
jgi:hypothetical protein